MKSQLATWRKAGWALMAKSAIHVQSVGPRV